MAPASRVTRSEDWISQAPFSRKRFFKTIYLYLASTNPLYTVSFTNLCVSAPHQTWRNDALQRDRCYKVLPVTYLLHAVKTPKPFCEKIPGPVRRSAGLTEAPGPRDSSPCTSGRRRSVALPPLPRVSYSALLWVALHPSQSLVSAPRQKVNLSAAQHVNINRSGW